MAATPILEQSSGSAAGPMVADLAGLKKKNKPDPSLLNVSPKQRTGRVLSVYPAQAGYEMLDELDYLTSRTIEPNAFFNPRFIAPAMPRLGDERVRFAVMRDQRDQDSRLRMVMPYTIERPSLGVGPTVIRGWANWFLSVGTPLIDEDDPEGVVEDFLSILAMDNLELPDVLVLPEMPLDGPVATLMTSVVTRLGLPLVVANQRKRAILQSEMSGDDYLAKRISSKALRNLNRCRRRLGEMGQLSYNVATEPEQIYVRLEEFLALEARGWKGNRRTAMAVDRFQSAFAREAFQRLSEKQLCQIHTLDLDGKAIASLLVLVEQGQAFTWKTCYDERYKSYSPGTLLMMDVTKAHLADKNIAFTDSCAVPEHPVMDRLWGERREIASLVIGLKPGQARATQQVASQLELYRRSIARAKSFRARVRRWLGI